MGWFLYRSCGVRPQGPGIPGPATLRQPYDGPGGVYAAPTTNPFPDNFHRRGQGARPTGPPQFPVAGVRAHPNLRWRIEKTDGKTVSPGVFPGFFDSTSPLGVLGVCNPQAVPRASEVAARFSAAFCAVKKRHLPATRTFRFTPEPGPLGGLPNLPSSLPGQKRTYPGSANLPGNRTAGPRRPPYGPHKKIPGPATGYFCAKFS